jgi:polycomb group RING finger protein 4
MNMFVSLNSNYGFVPYDVLCSLVCRSCLITYLENNSFCPICDVQIHKAKPFLNIK